MFEVVLTVDTARMAETMAETEDRQMFEVVLTMGTARMAETMEDTARMAETMEIENL